MMSGVYFTEEEVFCDECNILIGTVSVLRGAKVVINEKDCSDCLKRIESVEHPIEEDEEVDVVEDTY